MKNLRSKAAFLIVISLITFGFTKPVVAASGPTLNFHAFNLLTTLNPGVVDQGYATNAEISYLQRSGFFYFGQYGEPIANTTFGTAKIISERPFKVQYSINPGRVWSDGVAITAVDLLVNHITCSSKYASIANLLTPITDSAKADFNSSCYGGLYDQRVVGIPTVSSDKLSLTVEYDKYFPDLALVAPTPFPAHALVLLSDGKSELPSITEANSAKAIFEKVVATYDRKVLQSYAKTWSNSYNLNNVSKATNPLLLISNGGYQVESAVANQSISLVYNEKYNSGPQVQGIARINYRIISDGNAALQALTNREIDVLSGLPTADYIAGLKRLNDVKVFNYNLPTYEHLDLRVAAARSGGESYSGVFAGDSVRAQELRKAFLLAFPRDEIIEKVISPSNPQATRLDSLIFRAGESNYQNAVSRNGISIFTRDNQSSREAQALSIVRKYFPTASSNNPQVKVNLLWGTPTNARRIAVVQFAKNALARAGFDLNAPGLPNWASQLSSNNWDAAIFAWARADGSTERNLDYYCTDCSNNYMGYRDSIVDSSLSTIRASYIQDDLLANNLITAESQIYKNAWSLPLFQHPGVYATSSSLGNFKPGSNSLPGLWNYWEWTLPGAKPFDLFVASSTSSSSTDNSSNTSTSTQASHQNGWTNVNWSTDVLGAKGSLEQKFVPLALGQVATNPPRWVGWNNLDFCWEKLPEYGAGKSCGRVGWGFWSQSGEILTGNFDFALYDGVDFVKINSNTASSCERLGNSGNLSTAYNITCWTGVRIIPNHTYAVKLFADTDYGVNWWQATLTNETTGEVFNLGRIKSLINDNSKKLASATVSVGYNGVPKSCDDVPIIDTYMTNLIINGKQSAYTGFETGSCVKAIVSPNELSQGGFALRMGGEKPETRQLTGRNIQISSSNSKPVSSKPTTPSFSGVNFVGNKINIAVNIGSNAASRPDKVYLVAPKLGITAANPRAGSISGSNATWSIDFDKILGGTMIPLEVVSEKDGVKSDAAAASYQAPVIAPVISAVPPTPTNFKSRIVGSSAVVTAEVKIKAGALATNAYLVSKNLGFTSANPLEGEVAGSKIIMEIEVKPAMAGKKYPVSIYVSNSKGKSKSLEGVVSIPKAPSAPKVPSVAPKPSAPATVICVRASQTRTFAGTKCPPGWEQP